jgi:hypothetical protein
MPMCWCERDYDALQIEVYGDPMVRIELVGYGILNYFNYILLHSYEEILVDIVGMWNPNQCAFEMHG